MAATKDSSSRVTVDSLSYEGMVRSTLLVLGSNNPDGDIAASRDFWKHCRDAGVAPEVCAATIYGSIRHRHTGDMTSAQTATLREGVAEERHHRWIRVELESEVDAKNLKYALENAPELEKDIIGDRSGRFVVTNADRETVGKIAERIDVRVVHFDRSVAGESPTRDEWEVVVRRGGISVDDITAAAGRRPSEVTAGNAVFGGFRDDEQATAFSRKMTNAGYTTSSGPRREYTLHEAASEDVGILSRADRNRLEKEAYNKTDNDHRGKFHGRPAVMIQLSDPRQVRIQTLDQMTDAELVSYARKRGVKNAHGANENEGEAVAIQTVTTAVAVEGDSSAMSAAEVAPVISEPATCKIPWNKVEADPRKQAQQAELAAKYGPIRTAADVYKVCGLELQKENQEVFLLLPLNVRGELKAFPYEINRGQRSKVHVEPADVLRAAFDCGAEGFILIHNHPTGKVTPSPADQTLTTDMKEATKPHVKRGLCMIDHVVIGRSCAYSIFEKKLYKC